MLALMGFLRLGPLGLFAGLLSAVAAPATAHAQAKIVPADGIKTGEETDVEGWAPFLALTSTINLVSNSNVVGQVDGFSTLFGLGITSGADFVKGRHLMRSTLSINESVARTPVIDEWVKTNDVVKAEGLYNYFLTQNLGLFGRLKVETAAFAATDVRGVATDWVEKNPADPTMPIPRNQNSVRQRLASPFHPFTITESAGGFADPIRKPWLNLSFRAGLGGRHTLADEVLLIDDDKATPEVELQRLRDVHQLGAEAFAGVAGKRKDERASYKAGLSILFPFVNNDPDNRSAGALTRVGFEGALNFNVYSWMSIVYTLNVTRDPQLFAKGDELIQVQNTLLLTFQFTVVKKPEKAKAPSKEQLELEEAKKKAEEAEKRALEAEEKLKAQQPPPPPPPATDTPPTPPPGPAPTGPDAPAPAPTTTPP